MCKITPAHSKHLRSHHQNKKTCLLQQRRNGMNAVRECVCVRTVDGTLLSEWRSVCTRFCGNPVERCDTTRRRSIGYWNVDRTNVAVASRMCTGCVCSRVFVCVCAVCLWEVASIMFASVVVMVVVAAEASRDHAGFGGTRACVCVCACLWRALSYSRGRCNRPEIYDKCNEKYRD